MNDPLNLPGAVRAVEQGVKRDYRKVVDHGDDENAVMCDWSGFSEEELKDVAPMLVDLTIPGLGSEDE